MKYSLVVCLIALMFAAAVPCASAQSPELRKGVSVQMVNTQNATAMPAADNEDAWVVTVTREGSLYFGADPMTPDELADWMKTHPRNREATLYIKADARAPFADVEKVLGIGRAMEFDTPVLLTAQPEHIPPGTMVPPKGLEVSVASAVPSATIATLVQLLPSGQQQPLLEINNDQISWSALETTLRQHFQKGDDKVVLLKANASLPFAYVVHAIDGCRAAAAKVYVAEPGNL